MNHPRKNPTLVGYDEPTDRELDAMLLTGMANHYAARYVRRLKDDLIDPGILMGR